MNNDKFNQGTCIKLHKNTCANKPIEKWLTKQKDEIFFGWWTSAALRHFTFYFLTDSIALFFLLSSLCCDEVYRTTKKHMAFFQ